LFNIKFEIFTLLIITINSWLPFDVFSDRKLDITRFDDTRNFINIDYILSVTYIGTVLSYSLKELK